MSKVTVLMAVYNAEKYLHRSLDSLINQTFKDIQVVCIDDASTDSSLKILNDYKDKDKRINVLHYDKNRGLAYARNFGLTVATGEYITILDADDWYAPDTIESAVCVFKKYPNTDYVLYNLRTVGEDNTEKTYDWHFSKNKFKTSSDGSFEVMSGYDAFMESLDWGIHGIGMDRTEFYKKYPYDDTCRFYSDDNTTRLHFISSREVRCCKGKYYYYQHSSSVSHQVSVGHMDWAISADNLRSNLEKMKLPSEVLDIWEYERWKIIVGCYWFSFVNRKRFSSEERNYCLRVIKKAWEGVKLQRLKGKPIRKFGWYPFKGHWHLFQLEEKLYFNLRWLIGRR